MAEGQPLSIASTALSKHETRSLTRATYTIDEVAVLLGLSRNRAFVAARENRLPVPVIRVGRRMFVSRAALDRLLSGEQGAAAE
jgi:excisionase family DNA binding protein